MAIVHIKSAQDRYTGRATDPENGSAQYCTFFGVSGHRSAVVVDTAVAEFGTQRDADDPVIGQDPSYIDQ